MGFCSGLRVQATLSETAKLKYFNLTSVEYFLGNLDSNTIWHTYSWSQEPNSFKFQAFSFQIKY